jgi:dipeptidyl-peptidase 4
MKTLYFLLVFIVSSLFVEAQDKNLDITFNSVYRDMLFSEVQVPEYKSMNNGKYFIWPSGSRILKYSYRTGEFAGVLFSMNQLESPPTGTIDEYEISFDDSKLLITTNKERIYRHSYLADYYVYDINNQTSIHLTQNGKVQLCIFSPNGSNVAYVRNNNLFMFDLELRREKQISFDGEYNKIINGAPDWVYEEEFRFSKGYAWSPDGRYIAYYKTDESRVREFSFTKYGSLYPEEVKYKYPKAGEKNSIVSIHVFDTESGADRLMDTGGETDQYIPRIKWTRTPGMLSISKLNRLQNRFDLIIADASSGQTGVILAEENDKFIVEPTDDKIVFLDDGEHFLFYSETDGYLHYYLYDMSGNLINQVTQGLWDVIEFLGLDEESQKIYYSSYEESSLSSTVYSIGLNGEGKKKISDAPGWNTARFSKDYKYYIQTHSDTRNPTVVSLHKLNGKLIRMLEENRELAKAAEEYGLPGKELFTITTSGNIELNAYMYRPKNFNPAMEYPLMMYVYGGPESQEVRDEWGTSTWNYLLLQKGYVVVCVDNRGTDGKGEEFRKSTYMNLGKLELEDQIESARYLGSLSFIDSTRIGIWGSSYGGYMSSLCITRGNEIFKLAIALSPVTNWRYYDTIYTERFLRTPEVNPGGYDDYSPLNYADRLKGKFLLAHGMVDDNVHFQNSVDFSSALISAGCDFDMLSYPDQAHGIHMRAGLHLRQKMISFVEDNL